MKTKKTLKKALYPLPLIGDWLKNKQNAYHNNSLWGYIKFYFFQRDKSIYWPRTKTNIVGNPLNITIGKNCSIGGQGCYIQGSGRLIIGNYVRVATNVGIMSGTHSIYNHNESIKKTTIIGDYSWIGMNAVILPGVELGIRTIVAAGAVVTKSFPEGFCVLAGNPAVKKKEIDPAQFVPHNMEYEFYGYIPAEKFEKFKQKHLVPKIKK